MRKTHSKPLAARYGRGTAWARHAMCESALRLHIQRHVYVIQVQWLLASGNEMEHLVPASEQLLNLYDV
jgi:hypothetical protein